MVLFEAHLGDLRGFLKLKVEYFRMGFLYMKSTAKFVTAYIAIFRIGAESPYLFPKPATDRALSDDAPSMASPVSHGHRC